MTLMILSAAAIRNRMPPATCGILMKTSSSICLDLDGLGSSVMPASAAGTAHRYARGAWNRIARLGGPWWVPGAFVRAKAPGLGSIVFSRSRLDLVVELFQHRVVLGD